MERYTDFSAATTVGSGGYTSGDTVLNVASTASPFPSSGNFSVVVTDQSTGAAKGILRVNAKNSSTQWATAPEGTDFSAASGDNVYAVLSASAIDGIRADAIQTGPYASRPSSPHTGDLYIATDSLYQQRYNGSSWDQIFLGRKVTPPLLSDFSTWVNQGTATADDSLGGIYIVAPPNGSQNCRMLLKSAPSTPCTITIGMVTEGILDFSGGGVAFYNSSSGKFYELIYFSQISATPPCMHGLAATQWNSATSSSSNGTRIVITLLPSVIWLRITDDGSNRIWFYSMDGVHFVQFWAETNTAWITSFDQIAIEAHSENTSYPSGIWFFEYYET